MRRNENNRYFTITSQQLTVEFDPAHSRHTNIRNEARSVALLSRFQEFFRGAKATGRKPNGFHQILQCDLNRFVIVDDCDQPRFALGVHVESVVPSPAENNHAFVRRHNTLVLVSYLVLRGRR